MKKCVALMLCVFCALALLGGCGKPDEKTDEPHTENSDPYAPDPFLLNELSEAANPSTEQAGGVKEANDVVDDITAHSDEDETNKTEANRNEAENSVFTFIADEELKTAVVTGVKGDIYDLLDIPDKISGLTVTEIKERAFYGVTVKKVMIPESVNKIGANAFENTKLSEAIFAVTDGWRSDGKAIPPELLKNNYKGVAKYLKNTLCDFVWERT